MGCTSWSELNSPADLPDADDSRRPPRERKGPIPYRMGDNMGVHSKLPSGELRKYRQRKRRK
ncbi:hypothetical protein F442_22318, partial [Phytophthora nicotianae P10297]